MRDTNTVMENVVDDKTARDLHRHAAEVKSQLVLRGGDRLGASPGCAARPVPKLAERPCESDTAAVPGILAWRHADPGEVVEVFVGCSGGDGSIGDVEALEDVVLDDNLGKVLVEEVRLLFVDVEAEICDVFGFEAADDGPGIDSAPWRGQIVANVW